MGSNESAVLTILVSLSGLVGLVAIIGGFLHYRRERVLAHAERMKALELGRPLPVEPAVARMQAAVNAATDPDSRLLDPDRTLARKCYSTGFWIAFWGFVLAAGVGSSHLDFGVAVAMAAGAAAVGVSSIICGTVLAARASGRAAALSTINDFAKPVAEADGYDVVARRG